MKASKQLPATPIKRTPSALNFVQTGALVVIMTSIIAMPGLYQQPQSPLVIWALVCVGFLSFVASLILSMRTIAEMVSEFRPYRSKDTSWKASCHGEGRALVIVIHRIVNHHLQTVEIGRLDEKVDNWRTDYSHFVALARERAAMLNETGTSDE